ncbi:MAG: dTDP-4-dehydrorhamnose 3,5-epimerase family protein [Bacteroidota bacterium]
MIFKPGSIQGVTIKAMTKFSDKRGWLMEFFRTDEVDSKFFPAMAYISSTMPGLTRGPHEHRDQADFFCFPGPSTFRIYLWDGRKESPSYGSKMAFDVGQSSPTIIIVPPGVVHAYKNIGSVDGVVINLPNRLYAGTGRKEPVDEIRHENDPGSPYTID